MPGREHEAMNARLTVVMAEEEMVKPLESEFPELEKNARSTKVKIEGHDVTVQEKDWLLKVANEQMRKEGKPEFTQEEWDRDWARKQAATQ